MADWTQHRSSQQKERNDDYAQLQCFISTIGADQLLGILQYLPIPSVLAFGMTSRRFKDLADSNALWALICKREWGSRAVEASSSAAGTCKIGWKRLYRQMVALGSVSWRRLHQGDVVPAPRASHSMITVSHRVVIFGGGCDGGRHLDDTWIASLTDDPAEGVVWQQASMGTPTGRFGHSCTVVGDTLVLFGGINDKGIRQCDTWVHRDVHVASSEEGSSWQLLEVTAAPSPRGAHAGCYAGDSQIVVYGGIGSDGVRLMDTWMLDLSKGPLRSWHELITASSPPARSGHTLTWIGGKCMILFGGRGSDFEVLNDVWLLDMESDFPQWVELRACELHPVHDYPTPRAGHSATFIFDGRILIFGGEDARRSRKGDVWVLDPSAGLPVSRTPTCLEILHRRNTDSNKNTYARKFWKKLNQLGQPPRERSFHGACAVDSGNAVLIFGGMVDGELKRAAAAGLEFGAELYMFKLTP